MKAFDFVFAWRCCVGACLIVLAVLAWRIDQRTSKLERDSSQLATDLDMHVRKIPGIAHDAVLSGLAEQKKIGSQKETSTNPVAK